MSIQKQVLDALRAMVETAAGGLPVNVGQLPTENCLSVTVSTGRVSKETLANGSNVTLDVVLSIRHAQQEAAMDTLCGIHETLTRAHALPSGDGWQMLSIRTGSAPGYLAYEGTQWQYGSALTVEYTVE